MIGMLVAYNDAELLSLQGQSFVLTQENSTLMFLFLVTKTTTQRLRLPSLLP